MQQEKLKRRNLLGGLGVAAVTLLALKAVPSSSKNPVDAQTAAETEGDGYRLTEHIKKYYRSTTI